jgi:hypothetical protein
MIVTPFFPELRPQLAAMGCRIQEARKNLAAMTLAQLEKRFASVVPSRLFTKAAQSLNSRERLYTQERTFYGFLWQCLNPLTSCRKVVRQFQALFTLHNGPNVSAEDGAYCRARGRLPLKVLTQALDATAKESDRQAPQRRFLQGRKVKVVDGACVTLADTPENRAQYPKAKTQYRNTGFPLMRILVIFSLASGAVLSALQGNLHTSEMRLLQLLSSTMEKGDIMIGDQGFGNFVVLMLLQTLGVDLVARSARKVDGRRGKRLGKNDWLVLWKKGGRPSAVMTPEEWAKTPDEVTVRIVRGSLYQPGFRVRQVTLVSTLLDPVRYPAHEILQAYVRRWRLEMCLDDLKTTLGMETLRCQSPDMVVKEAFMHLIAHNLIRWLMIQAALKHDVDLARISFKGTLDALREFSQAMAQAPTHRKRQALWDELLRTLAADLVPLRPGRREPRAIKRKRNKYPRLNVPRHKFRDHAKRHDRRKLSRQRNQPLHALK